MTPHEFGLIHRSSARRRKIVAAARVAALTVAGIALLACITTGESRPSADSAHASVGPSASAASEAASGSTTAAVYPGPPAPAVVGRCQSLVASSSVKSAVTTAYGRQHRLVHIEPRAGTFFYGACDGISYAASIFDTTDGATLAEQVATQDGGSALQYFSLSADGSWKQIAGGGYATDISGCEAIPQIPSPLVALWNNCHTYR